MLGTFTYSQIPTVENFPVVEKALQEADVRMCQEMKGRPHRIQPFPICGGVYLLL